MVQTSAGGFPKELGYKLTLSYIGNCCPLIGKKRYIGKGKLSISLHFACLAENTQNRTIYS